MATDPNTFMSKVKRQFTAFLPVANNRRGECKRCGECCKMPYPCPMLGYDEEGLSYCRIYKLRPPSCRVYPRTEQEHVTHAVCGYHFESEEQSSD